MFGSAFQHPTDNFILSHLFQNSFNYRTRFYTLKPTLREKQMIGLIVINIACKCTFSEKPLRYKQSPSRLSTWIHRSQRWL